MAKAENNWFGASKHHRTLYGFTLSQAREKRKLSQWQFAKECEWSQPFQSRLEGVEENEVHINIINIIKSVLERFTIL